MEEQRSSDNDTNPAPTEPVDEAQGEPAEAPFDPAAFLSTPEHFKSGFAALVGRPNAGKSTFVNTVLDAKVSIATHKPQTTRNRIRAILNVEDEAQVVFVDTPGIHILQKKALNRLMVDAAVAAMTDADVVLMLIDAQTALDGEGKPAQLEQWILDRMSGNDGENAPLTTPVLLVVNKVDLLPEPGAVLPIIDAYQDAYPFAAIVPTSALKGHQTDDVVKLVIERLPQGPMLYPSDMYTDQAERFMAARDHPRADHAPHPQGSAVQLRGRDRVVQRRREGRCDPAARRDPRRAIQPEANRDRQGRLDDQAGRRARAARARAILWPPRVPEDLRARSGRLGGGPAQSGSVRLHTRRGLGMTIIDPFAHGVEDDDELFDDEERAEIEAEAPTRRKVRLPVVALVGRPNVGKSRTFNRLIGAREAIVEDIPGVTRDRNYGSGEWYGREFTVIDTGGFEPESADRLLEQMREQAQLAIDEADVIVFIVDGRVGRLPGDELIAQQLRTTEKPVFVAANKLDTYDLFAEGAEFWPLGLDEPFPVSAEHGLGFDELMDAVAAALPPAESLGEEPDGGTIQVAVIGKPNAGKSTLINRLLGSDRLLTSNIPGTTRDAIDTLVTRDDDGRQYLLIDTAGMRRKRSISQQVEKYSVVQAVKSMERADVALLVVDATQGVTDQDARIARLAADRGCAMAILLNKWDAIAEKETNTAKEFIEHVREKLPFCTWAPVLTMSAKTGQRATKVFDLVERVAAGARERVGTGELNRALKQILAQHQPPMGRARAIKFYLLVQVGIAPPTFVAQVNQPRELPAAYKRYMVNQLRERYGFVGAPIRLILRRPKGRHKWDRER